MKTTLRILPLMLGILVFFTQCEKEPLDSGSTINEEAVSQKDANDESCVVVQTLWAGAGQNNTDNGTDVGTDQYVLFVGDGCGPTDFVPR